MNTYNLKIHKRVHSAASTFTFCASTDLFLAALPSALAYGIHCMFMEVKTNHSAACHSANNSTLNEKSMMNVNHCAPTHKTIYEKDSYATQTHLQFHISSLDAATTSISNMTFLISGHHGVCVTIT